REGYQCMRTLRTLSAVVFLAVTFGAHSIRLQAAAPTIQWTTQLGAGAKVFAVDSTTNVYIQDGTNVIELDGNGGPITTIPVTAPGPFIVKRDSAGNFYFAGKNPGTPSGSYTCYSPASPSFFLRKLSPAGVPSWQTNFGVTTCVHAIALTDLGLDESGNVYI